MKSCLKIAVIAIGLLLILVAVAVLAAASQAEKAVRIGIEQGLGLAYRTEVRVGRADIDWRRGALTLEDVTVANPREFDAGPAVHHDRIVIDAGWRNLAGDPPTIRRIAIEGTTINLRHELKGGVNILRLIDNARVRDENTPTDAQPEQQDASGIRHPRFRIEEVASDGATIRLASGLAPGAEADLDVAPFTLLDVSDAHPVTIGELGGIVLGGYLRESLGTKGLLRPVADALRNALDGASGSGTSGPAP